MPQQLAGQPSPRARPERADAARNRQRILAAAEELFARRGADNVTMEDIAQAAGVGKGTLYRRYPDRASIAVALLNTHERALQERLLRGPPPLGPGAPPLDRLVAYGRARIGFLIEHRDIARATLDGSEPIPAGSRTPMSQLHIRVLLGQMDIGPADLDMLAVQLTAALDGPPLLYLSAATLSEAAGQISERLGRGWADLVQRVCRP